MLAVASSRRALLCLALAWLSPAPLRADPAPMQAASPTYERLIEEAVREYRLTHFPEARALFTRANELFGNARALRGLGMVEFELRNYAESIRCLRRALASEVRPLEGALRSDTEQLLDRAERLVGQFEILATPAPTRVLVDGLPGALHHGNQLTLSVGDHVLEVHAPGRAPARLAFKVQGGARGALHVSFAELEPPPDTPPAFAARTTSRAQLAPPSTPRARTRLYRSKWLWTGVGIAAATAAAGLGFGLTHRSDDVQEPLARWPVAIGRGP